MKVWRNKIQFIEEFKNNEIILSGNSVGIYFEFTSKKEIVIHFKPLNENFQEKLSFDGDGILLNFELDLINEDDVEYALDVMTLFNSHPKLQIKTDKQFNQLKQLLEMLKVEFYNEVASYIMFKTILKVLLLHLIRFKNDGFLEQDLNQKRVFQFLKLMETNYLEETNSEYYAIKIGVSVKRLNQILKEKLKLTGKQIIQQRQITEAKRQLVKKEITTKELAFKLGFDSISSFSRFFKKKTGMSPSKFKSQNELLK